MPRPMSEAMNQWTHQIRLRLPSQDHPTIPFPRPAFRNNPRSPQLRKRHKNTAALQQINNPQF